MATSGYQTLCHVRLPVSDISKSLPHSLVNRQADCGTAGHCSLLPSEVRKQLSNKHICTALSYFPMYQRTLCQYIKHISLHPVLWGTEANIKLLIVLNEWINYWLWKRSSCLLKGPVEETCRDAPLPLLREKDEICFIKRPCLLGNSSDMQKKALERASLSIGSPLGDLNWARFPGTLTVKFGFLFLGPKWC